jgi:hypothetical protein
MTSKLLEYLGLRRPILMIAPEGPGARLVRELGAGLVAGPEDSAAIRAAIVRLHREWLTGDERIVDAATTLRWTRRETARSMAASLDAAIGWPRLSGDAEPAGDEAGRPSR